MEIKVEGRISNIQDKEKVLVYTVEVRKSDRTIEEINEDIKYDVAELKKVKRLIQKYQNMKPNKDYSASDIKSDLKDYTEELKNLKESIERYHNEFNTILNRRKIQTGFCILSQETSAME